MRISRRGRRWVVLRRRRPLIRCLLVQRGIGKLVRRRGVRSRGRLRLDGRWDRSRSGLGRGSSDWRRLKLSRRRNWVGILRWQLREDGGELLWRDDRGICEEFEFLEEMSVRRQANEGKECQASGNNPKGRKEGILIGQCGPTGWSWS